MKYVLLLILFFPIFVFACPHFDEEGNLYYLYYEPGNPDNVIMAFQREKFYQIYYYDKDSNVIKEQFEIKFFESAELYNEYQDEKDKVYLEDEIKVISDNFSLKIPLTKIRNQVTENLGEDTMLAFYIVNTKFINKEMNDKEYLQIKHYLSDFPVELLDMDIFYIGSHELYNNRDWEVVDANIDKFLDQIEIELLNIELKEKMSIVRVSDIDDEYVNVSEVEYQVENKKIVITTDIPGYYVFVLKNGEIKAKEIKKEVIEVPKKEPVIIKELKDDHYKNIGLIILLSTIFIGGSIYILKK